MSLINYFFGTADELESGYESFWKWFEKNEKEFYSAVKEQKRIKEDFFDKLSPRLAEIKEGYYLLAGMCDNDTAELIITADGDLTHMGFVEELIEKAPQLPRWKFTAHKQATTMKSFSIEMNGLVFSTDNLYFFSKEDEEYPDEINIVVIRDDLTKANQKKMGHILDIVLNNLLGELASFTDIDNLAIATPDEVSGELAAITKLKDYITWRKKEFKEKYEGTWHITDKDEYALMEAALKNNNIRLAEMNTTLLKWDRKASHPWMASLSFNFEPADDIDGVLGSGDFKQLKEVRDTILFDLDSSDGYLYVGMEATEGVGEGTLFFACKDFRKPAKVFYNTKKEYAGIYNITYEIFKDKYWKSLNRYNIK